MDGDREWVKHRSLGRRHQDRKWPRYLRDFWLFCVTGLVALALANVDSTTSEVRRDQQANTLALCSFKGDLQRRVTQGDEFLKTHPKGILGIPASTLRVSIINQQASLKSLSPLVC